jgi:glycosyltransferase involved in cell wall biosynthesis
MKALVLYAYPLESDGQSLQGEMLYQGFLKSGVNAVPCHFKDSLEKNFYLKHFKPDVAFGIGFWGNVPEVIKQPLKFGVKPIPWFNADSWVANYQDEFNQLDLMFTTSEWVRQVYKRDGIDVSKIVPMHIGIDTDLFRPINNNSYKKAIRRMFGIKNGEKMILTIGGDVTSKGAQEMFHALAKVNEEFKDWKYVCKSWPSECASKWHDEEQKLIEELGIKDKVIFIDDEFDQEFMVHVLNACDIYAAPSRVEGFGMIQVEAMACEKPVISINKMGPGETILHNKTGFLAKVSEEINLKEEWTNPDMGFPKKEVVRFDAPKTFAYRADINDLYKHSIKLLTEPELCEEMGNAGRKHVLKNLDYRHISQKMWEVTCERLGLAQKPVLLAKKPQVKEN